MSNLSGTPSNLSGLCRNIIDEMRSIPLDKVESTLETIISDHVRDYMAQGFSIAYFENEGNEQVLAEIKKLWSRLMEPTTKGEQK